MLNVPVDEAYLIGGWLASALWGSFTVLVFTSLYLMVTRRPKDLYKPATWVMIIMYTLATTHVFLALHRIIVALIDLRDIPDGPITYLGNIGIPINRAKDTIYITNLVIGDSIVVWRCWAVWGGNYFIVALPIAMVLGTAIAGYGSIHQYFITNPNPTVSVAWGTSMFVISFTTNVLVTILTASRIWYMTRRQTSILGSDSRYRTVILLVIESGAIIAAAKLIEFTLFQIAPGDATHGNNSLYILFDMMPQITGLLPTLILVVVNAGLTRSTSYYNASAHAKPAPGGDKVKTESLHAAMPSSFAMSTMDSQGRSWPTDTYSGTDSSVAQKKGGLYAIAVTGESQTSRSDSEPEKLHLSSSDGDLNV